MRTSGVTFTCRGGDTVILVRMGIGIGVGRGGVRDIVAIGVLIRIDGFTFEALEASKKEDVKTEREKAC